ncbi:MAG: DUF86 domain-containing protein [Acidobacteriota bacterium]
MRSDTLDLLEDMQRYIQFAQQFVADLNIDGFRNDVRTTLAVIRCLEVISEASRRLPQDLKDRHPSLPWKNIAGAGNVYRHDYAEVAPVRVWETVHAALPALLAVVTEEIERASH